MSRTRRIRQFLDPEIAKREVKNISQIYQAMGYDVDVSTDTEKGSIVHKITASKGQHSSIIVELHEIQSDKKRERTKVFEETPRPELTELEPSIKTGSSEAKIPTSVPSEPKPRPKPKPKPIVESPKMKEKPKAPQLKSHRKEDIAAYAEQDETGIVPALVAEGALVFEDGSIKVKKWIAREQFLHARKYFKRVGLKL